MKQSFVDHYNHHRHLESLNNVTPAGVYFGRDKAFLREREKIKKQTIRQRDACITASKPHNQTNQMSQALP